MRRGAPYRAAIWGQSVSSRARRRCVQRRDGRLDLVGTRAAHVHRVVQDGGALRRSWRDPSERGPDPRAGPSSPAGSVRASRRECCSSISARSPQASGSSGRSRATIRVIQMASSQSSTRTSGPSRGGVALVEDQVEDREDAGASARPAGLREVRGRGSLAVADLPLRAHQPLRDGRLRLQEGARDLPGGESAHRAQGQRDAGVHRQRGVTAGEDQSEPVVGDIAHVVADRLELGQPTELFGLRRETEPRGGAGRSRGCAPSW